jgi:hypothetical protein
MYARVAIGTAVLAVCGAILGAGGADAAVRVDGLGLPAPVAAGDSAANIQLSGREKWVMVRWVARRTGTLRALHLRLQADGSSCRRSGKQGYGRGDGGGWLATTHPVLPTGRPAMPVVHAARSLRACSSPLVDAREGVARLPMNLDVVAGAEYATVVRNTDRRPARNFTSLNFLYAKAGLVGANARNERSSAAPDAFYGLDPRELVGYSVDGGRTWALPGGPYGRPAGRNFLPTYVQEYSDGQLAGQPYYYTREPDTRGRTMVFGGLVRPWTIRSLGAFSLGARGTLTLAVDGRVRARARMRGAGMLRAPIVPVVALPGQTVTVTATGLALRNVVADTAWGRLVGMHLTSAPWRVRDERNFTAAAPIYPLPACGSSCAGAYRSASAPFVWGP